MDQIEPEGKIKPLRADFTENGSIDFDSALDWLAERDMDTAGRFNTLFGQTVTDLCRSLVSEIAQGGRPFALPNEGASFAFSRPVYKHRFELSKKRQRRSSSGVWFVFYFLTDNDKDGAVDTLNIAAIRHGAAASLWNPEKQDEESDNRETIL